MTETIALNAERFIKEPLVSGLLEEVFADINLEKLEMLARIAYQRGYIDGHHFGYVEGVEKSYELANKALDQLETSK